MGKTIAPIAENRGHNIVFKTSLPNFTASDIAEADVCIEFTSPEAAYKNIKKCLEAGKSVVSGTTGWLNHWPEIKEVVAQTNGSFFYSSNFSIGVNIFFALNQYLARIMNNFPDYDVNINEIHHTQKKDAPSGTALTLAEKIVAELDRKNSFALDATSNETLNITAKRIDAVPGTHTVKYTSPIDDITLTHTAHSREGFATGAVLAAEWLMGKKGVFGMPDLLNI